MLTRVAIFTALALQFPLSAFGAPLQFSFDAPPGWTLREDSAKERYYWLAPVGDLPHRCSLRLGAEGVQTLEDSQSEKSVRFREAFSGPSPPVIRRSKLRSRSGERILKADVRSTPVTHPQLPPAFFRYVVYSFRGRDGRVYTLECYPPPRDGAFFDHALDDLARSIRL